MSARGTRKRSLACGGVSGVEKSYLLDQYFPVSSVK